MTAQTAALLALAAFLFTSALLPPLDPDTVGGRLRHGILNFIAIWFGLLLVVAAIRSAP